MECVELVRTDLAAEPASVRAARHLVLDAVEGWADDDVVDAALVITSELATNATLHALTGFTVVVLRRGACLRIEVHDGSQRLPRRKHYSDQSATGRGLPLVEALSTLSGAERTEGGKVVWAELGEAPADRPGTTGSVADLRVAAPEAPPAIVEAATGSGTTSARAAPRPSGSPQTAGLRRTWSSAGSEVSRWQRTCRSSSALRRVPSADPHSSSLRPVAAGRRDDEASTGRARRGRQPQCRVLA